MPGRGAELPDSRQSTLVRTKLRPPRLTPDVVVRERLLERLEGGRPLPLTLVSAPGGYGKSTLIASWLAESGKPHAWLTLEERDDELPIFLEYLVEAVRTVVPDACGQTRAIARSPSPSDPEQVAAVLANELDSLPRDVTLVLDDSHHIHADAVLEVMSALLRHPPAPLHLVVIGRFDPSLPLARLRGQGQLVEIREEDLRFTSEEVECLFGDGVLEEGASDRLLETTEGWAVGLHLARARVRSGDSLDELLPRLGGGAGSLYQYLVTEVLATVPPERQPELLAASLLDRFCDPLCRAIVGEPGEGSESFVSWATRRGLFLQPLGERGGGSQEEWFRFHGLFRDVLRQELARSWPPETTSGLHRRAARWLEDHGSYEEALEHREKAGDEEAAIALVERHRVELMNREEWSRLQRWLDRIPEAARRARPELLLARAWIQEDQVDFPGMIETIETLDAVAEARPDDVSEEPWRGELDVLKSVTLYFDYDGAAMAERAARALARLAEDNLPARGMALALQGWGHQMQGDLQAAESVLLGALQDARYRNTTVHGLALTALCFLYWVEGDVGRLERTARELEEVAAAGELGKSAGYARYLLGLSQLERGDLGAAEATFGPFVRQWLPVDLGNAFHGTFGGALSQHGRGEWSLARELATTASARALALARPELLAICEAFEAELALREGRVAAAAGWAAEFEPSIAALRNRLFHPEITYAKVLLTLETPGASAEAKRLLEKLEGHLSSIHHRRLLVDVRVLEALRRQRSGDPAGASQSLRMAVDEAYPRSLRRPFTDLGPVLDGELAGLLAELAVAGESASFVESLRSAEGRQRGAETTSTPIRSSDALVDQLTDRELEVLGLLGERLTDKEIAGELGIASKTVRRHNSNLFSKLGVTGRREAVARGRELGLLVQQPVREFG